ncbi:MAG: hypothetical protein PHH77_08290 [Victivallaceae bacterium]|nr:hypothetical protein [Victivallaceae bacterium]
MPLSNTFESLFETNEAQARLAQLGGRVILDTFSLTTTSLRHLTRWYDRLDDIANGRIGGHSNFLSDPESLGLVSQNTNGIPALTEVGQQFLDTKEQLYNRPPAAEYELIKLLYFGSYTPFTHARNMLNLRKGNLQNFLQQCRLTPSSHYILNNAKALTIGELISGFPGAVERYLQLDESTLIQLVELGESGFTNLPTENYSSGLSRLCRKIGSDYTRAPDRRRNMLLSMTLLEIRQNLIITGTYRTSLSIPYPFCNLVSEFELLNVYDEFTDDLIIEAEGSNIFVTLSNEAVSPAIPELHSVSLRPNNRRPRRVVRGTGTTTHDTRNPPENITINVRIGLYAEDYVLKWYLEPNYDRITRLGHTNLETQLLPDDNLPGADFLIGDIEFPERFIEIKATGSPPPASFTLTRNEYARAKLCHERGIPYEVYIVAFPPEGTVSPTVYHWPDFATVAEELNLEDLLALQLPIQITN